MPTCRVGAVMVVQNDAETVERSLASFYEHVEFLVVSTDVRRGWSGTPITPDDTRARIRAFDKDNKIEIIEGDFYRHSDPMRNDTLQRQFTADRLTKRVPGLDWIVQIDADEVFQDFAYFADALGAQPPTVQGVSWRWMLLFNRLADGRYLVIVNRDGEPLLEQFAVAHRPHVMLASCREPVLPLRHGKPDVGARYVAPADLEFGKAILHYSYAKSEARVWEKLQTWSHAHEINAEDFFALWQRSTTDWQSIRDFHPTYPPGWPALKPFSLEELRNVSGRRPARYNLAQKVVRKLGRAFAPDN